MSHESTLKLEQDINNEMSKVADWFSVNKLSLNYKKTELLVVSKRKQAQQINLHINGNLIQQKNQIKYLGVIIDNKLNWKPHINNISGKISKGIFALIPLRNYVDL